LKDYESFQKSAEYIRSIVKRPPETALVLGSGLGALVSEIDDAVRIPYGEIPDFPKSGVEGHSGELIAGKIGGSGIFVFSGRTHFYEGYEMADTAYFVGVLKLLGVKRLLLTNAAGSVKKDIPPGSLVLIRDHIKLSAQSPLRGRNIPELGERFFDMSDAYDSGLRAAARKCADRLGMTLPEGVYAYMSGPQYETPAEIRMLSLLGADVVGMSTVAETIAAAWCGIKVLCVSCVSNYAAGVSDQPISHREVIEIGRRNAEKFSTLIKEIIKEIT